MSESSVKKRNMSLSNNYSSYLEILNQLTYDRKKFAFSTIKKNVARKAYLFLKNLI